MSGKGEYGHMSVFPRIPRIAAGLVVLVGGVVLAGWFFDLDAPGLNPVNMVRMKANAAFAFICAGTSLILTDLRSKRKTVRIAGRLLACVTALIGILVLFEYATGIDLGIDQALVHEAPGAFGTSSPGRIAPNAAFNFMLLGCALLLLEFPAWGWVVSVISFVAGSVSVLALMAYMYNAEPLPGVLTYTTIAFYTAAAFFILAVGVLFALRNRGAMRLLASRRLGGKMVRRLLPMTVLVPLALGWLRMAGYRAGYFGDEYGVALMVTGTIVLLILMGWNSAAAVERTDISRLRAEESLRTRAEELAQSNEELEQFAYVASHDLQEPLRAISGFTQILARRYRGKLDAEADEFIAYVVEGTLRMQTLINDLLDYSRAGRMSGEVLPTDCSAALDQALENLNVSIAESGAEIRRDPLPVVSVDEKQLVRVFQNLIGNAIKFRGPVAPRIRVLAAGDGKEWVLSVQDNGIGIEPKYFERIFLLFQRLHRRDDYSGTGIGLAICKKIIERRGGRIWVESEFGRGTTFHFSLPAAEPEPETETELERELETEGT
ncbi:MAG TPA: ATP-binding protein [Candidatus Deferrimicrobiaceae bacterium]|jgi:signal transduction histidine kinase